MILVDLRISGSGITGSTVVPGWILYIIQADVSLNEDRSVCDFELVSI